eukprot:symbB.v1.2.031949.t1/scaffold3768.1/size50661/2
MSGANSAPVFEQRARELGIPEGLLDTLKNAHVNTFARLAYLTPYQPGQPDDSVLFDKLEEIATRPLADFEKACFRQLFYEASAITVSELKQKVERVDSSEPATLPLAERMHRLQNQRNTLSGVHFSVFTEPSNKLVDQYFQMMTDQQLVWLPWSKLASRSDELQLNKKDLQLTFDANGNLKMSKKELEAQSDLKGEIQVRQALRRRSLAVDLTGLIDFQVQETWHEKMFECLAKQAPSGYKQTSVEQCKEADKTLWTMLAERTRGNVRVALAAKPVQDAFEALSSSTESLIDCERLCKALEKEEKELHQSLAPHLAEVLEGKNLILFEKLLSRFNYPDMEVVRFMRHGVDLVGEHPASPIFPLQLIKATTTPELLLKSAVWRNETMAASPIHGDEPAMAAKLWEVTNAEVERGFLKGPYDSLDQVRKVTGCRDLVVNRRFLLIQGEAGKPRAIDDCKTSGLNAAYVQNNKLILQDLDAYVALCSYVASSMDGSVVKVKMSDGTVKTAQLSGDFQGNISWKGKCLDLEKAYRQVPVSAASLAYSVALVHDLQGKPRYFLSQSLPFGACSSVYAFNRIGAAIRFLIQHVLKGVLTVFYDDFPLLKTTACSQLMESMVAKFLTLLGWKHAMAGDKGVPFQHIFTVLGAEINLTGMHLGKILVANKPGRLERMERLVMECKKVFPPVKHQMQVLAGLLQYAVGNSLGFLALAFDFAAGPNPGFFCQDTLADLTKQEADCRSDCELVFKSFLQEATFGFALSGSGISEGVSVLHRREGRTRGLEAHRKGYPDPSSLTNATFS